MESIIPLSLLPLPPSSPPSALLTLFRRRSSSNQAILRLAQRKQAKQKDLNDIAARVTDAYLVTLLTKDLTIRDSVTSLPARTLVEMMKRGDLSVTNVVAAFCLKARSVNQQLNCLTEEVFEEALQEAKRKDALLQGRKALQGTRVRTSPVIGPQGGDLSIDDQLLFGLPISVKDNFLQRNTDSTIGTVCHCLQPSETDGLVVALLRDAGAIPFCRTAVPQCLMMPDSSSSLFGVVRNPHHQDRTPGGSSGGEAALIAAGASPLGIATDIGGSIRIPCHYSGVTGFKPTSGRLTNDGRRAGRVNADGLDSIKGVIGPIGRNANDCAVIVAALLSHRMWKCDPWVPRLPFRHHVYPFLTGGDRSTLLSAGQAAGHGRKLKFGYYVSDGYFEPAPSCKRAVVEAMQALERLGYECVRFDPPDVGEAVKLYYGIMSADGGMRSYREFLGDEPLDPMYSTMYLMSRLWPSVRWIMGSVLRRLFGWTRVADILEVGGEKSVYEYQALCQRRFDYSKQFLREWEGSKIDVLICPGSGLPALPHGAAKDLTPSCCYTFLFNLINFPAGSIPVTTTLPSEEHYSSRPPLDLLTKKAQTAMVGAAGTPAGVQVITRPFEDEECLYAMALLEAALQQHKGGGESKA